jgi:hypothetical protein
MSTGGKGDKPRPYSVPMPVFDNNWDNIFKKNKKSDEEKFDDAVMQEEFYDQEDRKDK